MWRYLTLVGATLCFLMGSSPARASTYPGQREAGPMVRSAVTVAQTFWTERGVIPCPNPTVMIADDLSDPVGGAAQGRGWREGCTLWLLAENVRDARWELRPNRGGGMLEQVCTVATHELGHLAGLGHTDDGIMRSDFPGPETPFACRQWASAERRAYAKVARKRADRKHGRGRGVG